MASSRPIFMDMETESIEARPDYPPKPLGVGVRGLGRPKWVGWGYPTENNGTRDEGRKLIESAYRSGRPIVFHHAQFDLDVIETHLGLKLPPWHQIHCTQVLAFLYDPNQKDLKLKTLAELHLGRAAEERDELVAWIKEHVLEAKRLRSTAKIGEFYCRAPGKLVGRYCLGDLDMTCGLFDFFAPVRRELAEAYERERRLISALLDVERQGTPISPRIQVDLRQWEKNLEGVDRWLSRKLKTRDLDCDKKEEVADGLEKADLVDAWVLTATGKRSVAWENLLAVCKDPMVVNMFHYRSKLTNAIRTFARPWVRQIEGGDGRARCHWNPTPRPKKDGTSPLGARTGRLSSNPNWQNVPTEPVVLTTSKREAQRLERKGVACLVVPKGFEAPHWALPHLRDYVSPPKGMVLNNRDYSQQELRALAHYAGGQLLQLYADDPFRDIHDTMRELINRATGANWARRPVKAMGFGVIYTMGLPLLSERTGTTMEEAGTLRKVYKQQLDMDDLEKALKHAGKVDEPIWTWGGRRYYSEPPKFVENQWRTFEYKLLNTLIQGSAADAIKEFMVRYYEEKGREGFVSLLVHDETVAFAPRRAASEQMRLMAAVMESLEFRVPMITDGKSSTFSWARAKSTKKEEGEWRTDSGVVRHPAQRKRKAMVQFDCLRGRTVDGAPTRSAPRRPTSNSFSDAARRAAERRAEGSASTKKPRPTSKPRRSRS